MFEIKLFHFYERLSRIEKAFPLRKYMKHISNAWDDLELLSS